MAAPLSRHRTEQCRHCCQGAGHHVSSELLTKGLSEFVDFLMYDSAVPADIDPFRVSTARALVRRIKLRKLFAKVATALVPGKSRRHRLRDTITWRHSDDDRVAYPFADGHGYMPDFKNPRSFPEKIRWTFQHHINPLHSLVADKIAVRDYLLLKGAVIPPPKLFATGWRPDDIHNLELPQYFALKASNSCGANLFHFKDVPIDYRALAQTLKYWRAHEHWRSQGELFYRQIPWRFLIEEFLPTTFNCFEYKVFCFHGEPEFISVIVKRGEQGLVRSIRHTDWTRANFGTRGLGVSDDEIPRPKELKLILDDARRLSSDLIMARVDYLHFDDRLVFSEITLANDAARRPLDPREEDLRLGALIDLSRSDEYVMRGENICAQLAWPPRLIPKYKMSGSASAQA